MARQAASKSKGQETSGRKGRAHAAPRRVPPAQVHSVNPATGETLAKFPTLTAAEIDSRLQRAAEAFGDYRHMPFAERAALMRRAADILGEREEAYARLMTQEMGKLIGAAREELRKCAWACRHYAEHAEALLAIEVVETGPQWTFVRFQPLGPVLAVMPWNFPFWRVFRFAAPALMAGNVALLKHASNVPQCALAIEDVFRDAGFAPGVFQTLLVGSQQVPAILDDDRVVAATVTGSEAAGAAVAARAGERIKRTVVPITVRVGFNPAATLIVKRFRRVGRRSRDRDYLWLVDTSSTAGLSEAAFQCPKFPRTQLRSLPDGLVKSKQSLLRDQSRMARPTNLRSVRCHGDAFSVKTDPALLAHADSRRSSEEDRDELARDTSHPQGKRGRAV
jgi:hypothetical protein